jgi:hypothetical protein
MTFIHGRNTYISLNAVDLSAYVTTSDISRKSDSHDVTTYGKNSHVFSGGLLGGDASMSGVYDSAATVGPRAAIRPLVGTVVELIRRPEGTGSGKPQDRVNVLVAEYVETNPVAEMITWTCKMQLSDDINATAQV